VLSTAAAMPQLASATGFVGDAFAVCEQTSVQRRRTRRRGAIQSASHCRPTSPHGTVTVHRCTLRSPLTGCQVISRPRDWFSRHSKWTDTLQTDLVQVISFEILLLMLLLLYIPCKCIFHGDLGR